MWSFKEYLNDLVHGHKGGKPARIRKTGPLIHEAVSVIFLSLSFVYLSEAPILLMMGVQ